MSADEKKPKRRWFGFGRRKDSEPGPESQGETQSEAQDETPEESLPQSIETDRQEPQAEDRAPAPEPDPEPAPEHTPDLSAPGEDTPKAAADIPAAEDPAPEEASEPAPEPEPSADAPTEASGTAPEKKQGFFSRLRAGLSRSTNKLSEGITGIFTKAKLDDDTLEELEDLLISADLGVSASSDIVATLAKGRYDKEIDPREVKRLLAGAVADRLRAVASPLEIDKTLKPHVVLIVGVNGTGKTTTIGKLAHRLRAEGKRVVLAAGDTFRAAAIEQLKIWGERTGCEVIARELGSDAAGLAFDALKHAKQSGADVLLIDTAGRLQNKQGLMDELRKIRRVLAKQDESAPHSVILTLDATTGQNALSQVDVFKDVAGVTGLVMTKLDGTARGGILVALADKFALPIHAVGVGEGVEDFQPFDPDEFAAALAGAVEDAA